MNCNSRKIFTAALALGLFGIASAQSWTSAYESGLTAARAQKWVDARVAFKKAATLRPEDFSQPTTLPGSVTDPQLWRNGAAYSPNFLAAYAGFKHAQTLKDDKVRTDLLTRVAEEFNVLVAKGQKAPETVYFLNSTYGILNQTDKQKSSFDLATRAAELTWRIDGEVVSPDEKNAVVNFVAQAAAAGTGASAGTATVTVEPASVPAVLIVPDGKGADGKGGQPAKKDEPPTKGGNPTADDDGPVKAKPPKTSKNNPGGPTPVTAPLEKVAAKFALVIGNSESKLPGNVDFAATDAAYVKDQLVQFAGYQEANVRVLTNVSAVAMLDAARKLADGLPDDAVVAIYFTGIGTHVDGKDYLAGVDTAKMSDTSSMLEKAALFRVFMQKGAKVFAFFQVNRPISRGNFFGKENMMVGQIAQMMATIPGGKVSSMVRGGKSVGLFTEAFGAALASMKTNRVPILEFGWQVFERIRAGVGNTNLAGGSAQIPTLPSYTNMSADTRF